MNKATNSIPPAAAPDQRDLIIAMEDPLANAVRMASILTTLLEDSLSTDMSSVIGEKGRDRYHLTRDDAEDMLFAVYQTKSFISASYRAFRVVLA